MHVQTFMIYCFFLIDHDPTPASLNFLVNQDYFSIFCCILVFTVFAFDLINSLLGFKIKN